MRSNSYVKGKIVKILFESSTGYKVGLFKVKEASQDIKEYVNLTITFTGTFMPLNNELTYQFNGYFFDHSRFGYQFNVVSYDAVIPSDIDGIIMYLSSDIFKGIGPKLAKEIVNTFGSETINEIKNENPLLYKVKGMSEKKAKGLIKKILEYEKTQEMILDFNKMGFTTEEVLKIFNKYGDNSYNIVENNIYLLEGDINFFKLDKVFLRMHEETSSVRINALIKYAIKIVCYSRGDTLTDKESLYLEVSKYFSVCLESGVFLSHLEDLISAGGVVKFKEYVTLREFYETESNIASTISYLNNIKCDFSKEKILEKIRLYEKRNKISFNQSQVDAITGSIINNVFIITGGPGTGKTTIIKAVVDIYKSLVRNLELNDITLLAPTGKAAKRLGESVNRKASTIHKFLKWNKDTKSFSVNKFNPSSTKVVVIDEFSMVDIFLFFSLLDGLGKRVKLILVGDANQLPSIAPGNILSDLLSIESINGKFLDHIYRTSEESYIIPLASDIKNRVKLESVPSGYDDFKFICSSDINIKNYVVEVANRIKAKGISEDDFQVLVPMYKGENGIDNMNVLLQSIFNPKSDRKREIMIRGILYREGDKVIQLVNDVDNNIYNGDTGYIKSIIGSEVVIDFSGNMVLYKYSKFDEFTHAYAISVHKSQGSEYSQVLVVIPSNMKRMLYNKLIYTAVTRAKKGLIIIGTVDSFNYSVMHEYSENRITALKNFF